MTFETFSTGSSILHRLDVRTKLLAALLLIGVLAVSTSFPAAAGGLATGAALVLGAGLDRQAVIKRLLLVNGFVLFLWITLPLSYPGTPLFSFGPVPLSREGILLALLITIKTNGAVLIMVALIATSTVSDLGHGLSRLKIPDVFCMLLLFSYRYLSVIHQEYQRLQRAARLRCFQARTSIHTYRTYGYLFGMTLVKSHHRAERVRKAMVLRGFDGRFYSLNTSTIGSRDIGFAAVAIVLTATMLVLEWRFA